MSDFATYHTVAGMNIDKCSGNAAGAPFGAQKQSCYEACFLERFFGAGFISSTSALPFGASSSSQMATL